MRKLARSLGRHRQEILAAWQSSQFDRERLERFNVVGWRELSEAAVRERFLGPLLDLLVRWLRTSDRRLEYLYQNERLRYAPHQAAPEARVAFFEEVLPPDEAAIVKAAGREIPTETIRDILGELHAPLLRDPGSKAIRLLALGDCLMGELRVFLSGECRAADIPLDFRSMYFSAQQGRGIVAHQVLDLLAEHPMDLLAFSFLTFKGIPPYTTLLQEADGLGASEVERRATQVVGLMRSFLEEVREHTEAPFLLHNASGLPLGRFRRRLPILPPMSPGRRAAITALNEQIEELAEGLTNTMIIDEVDIVARHGHRACERPVVRHGAIPGAQFHTSTFGALLVPSYMDVLKSYEVLGRTKVLLVDFDNTLWDGVMADGDVRHHEARQRILRRLKDSGVLLVAVSKNDPDNVRWEEMALEPDDFVLRKIGWNLKAESVSQAAQELDLGLDSFVLLDDNPVERDLVQGQLPEVRALDGDDPEVWRWVERMLQFPNTRDTDVARARTQIYREQAQRREAMAGGFDYPSMMKSLDLQVSFRPARHGDLSRVSELVSRTNQFNTTTRRHDLPTLQRFLEDDEHEIYVASLSDRFGDLGLVSVVIVERRASERVCDSFIMSCRAMGFGLEQLMLGLVVFTEGRDRPFVGEFYPTDRNMPAMSLFRDAGFVARTETEWVLTTDAELPSLPAWFSVTAPEGLVTYPKSVAVVDGGRASGKCA